MTLDSPPSSFRIGLIPLDDRPCNLEQVEDLARIARAQVVAPPRRLVGSHADRPDRFESLARWLEAELPRLDALVLSADQWLYGGLIQSRKLDLPTQEALQRLERLAGILACHPRIPVYAFHVLLRLTVTVNAAQSEDDWRNIFDYSVWAGRPGHPEAEARLTELRARIPEALLQEYLEVRRRNHSANLALVSLASHLRFAWFGQEDCAEHGLHRPEKARLQQAIDALPAEQRARFLVLTGADELGALGVMRALMERHGVKEGSWELPVAGLSDPALERVSAYEDIPALQNLELHFRPSAYRPVATSADRAGAGCVRLFPFGPEGQGDLCFTPAPTPAAGSAQDLRLQAFVDTFRPGDALLDLSHGNGADPTLIGALAERLPLGGLRAFSAWNTTGNRLGTLVAHLSVAELARRAGTFDAEADRFYLESQLLDHAAYQAQVRSELGTLARARGWNIWALPIEGWKELSAEADRRLQALARKLGLRHRFRASLPWPRLFEVSIRRQSGDPGSGP